MFFDPRHAGSDLGITEEQVRAVTVPTLLVHGREDKVVPPEVSWTMVGLLPDADLHVFARCGHWTQIERAAEFNALVADFLNGGVHDDHGRAGEPGPGWSTRTRTGAGSGCTARP